MWACHSDLPAPIMHWIQLIGLGSFMTMVLYALWKFDRIFQFFCSAKTTLWNLSRTSSVERLHKGTKTLIWKPEETLQINTGFRPGSVRLWSKNHFHSL